MLQHIALPNMDYVFVHALWKKCSDLVFQWSVV